MMTKIAEFDLPEEQTVEAGQNSDAIELSIGDLDLVGGGIAYVFG